MARRSPRVSFLSLIWAWTCLRCRGSAFGHFRQGSRPINRDRAELKTIDSAESLRIVGGANAPEERYEYMALLKTRNGDFVCGGSLIAPDIVLSAAHCAFMFAEVEIARHSIFSATDEFETFQVKSQIVHPDYDDTKYPFDFLLIQLDGRSSYSPIRLNRDPFTPEVGLESTVIGFGATHPDSDNSLSPILKHVTVNVVSNGECSKARLGTLTYAGLITDDMLCASDFGEDACSGDSGSPLLILDENGNDLQIGLVSWGFGCASESFPGVYGRISYAADWIDENVCEYSDVPPSDFNCNGEATEPPASVGVGETGGTTFPVSLVLQLDGYPDEMSWVITDVRSRPVAQRVKGFYASQKGQRVVESISLRPGEIYTFVIHDSHGDGICCNFGQGYYEIYLGSSTDKEEDLLVSGAGSFGRDAVHVFGMPKEMPVERSPMDVPLTVAVKMDQYPEEVGWTLEQVGASVTDIALRPIGLYGKQTQSREVMETITIQKGGLYRLTFVDAFGDGTCCLFGSGYYRAFLGTRDTKDESKLVVEQAGAMSAKTEHYFHASLSGSAVASNNFVTLQIQFDRAPLDTAWSLEMEGPNNVISLDRDRASEDILKVVAYKGPYGPTFANRLVTETHYLPPIPPNVARRFFFTLFDSSGNGLCCEDGTGFYKLFYGPIEDNVLLASGDGDGLEKETKEFFVLGTVPTDMPTVRPTDAPTLALSPSPTPGASATASRPGVESPGASISPTAPDWTDDFTSGATSTRQALTWNTALLLVSSSALLFMV